MARKTPAQRRREIAKSLKKPKIKPKPAPFTTITLKYGHAINNIHYGPGNVRVRQDVADLLMEQDRHRDEHEIRFYDTQPLGGLILPGRYGSRRAIKMTPAQMDVAMATGQLGYFNT